MVHGLSGDMTWWRNNLGKLCELTEVYALDLLGFGRSRTRRRFSLEAQLDALANWLAAVQVHRAIVVGHSLGGYLAALLAARSPATVAKLVLVDPAIFPPGYGWGRLVFGLACAPFHLSLNFIPTLIRGSFTAGPVTLFRAARDLLNVTILDELRPIGAETLLVWGKGDTVVPPALGAAVAMAISGPAVRPVMLRGGHVSMWDDAQGFNDAVAAFVSRSG
jgi:pimeloyl-ACP methyl ester carboxylesterase